MTFLLLACTEYDLGADKAEPAETGDTAGAPELVEFPESPDGGCPASFPVSTPGWVHVFDWNEAWSLEGYEGEVPLFDRSRTLGAVTWRGTTVYALAFQDAAGWTEWTQFYQCHGGDVWAVGRWGAVESCDCANDDCIFPVTEYVPGLLAWSDAAVAEGRPWSSLMALRSSQLVIVDCVEALRDVAEVPDYLDVRVPRGLEVIETAAGSFEAQRLDRYDGAVEVQWVDWYSPAGGGLIRAETYWRDLVGVWEVTEVQPP